MKILHLTSARSFGGGERHFADLVNHLDARGHQVFVALIPDSPLVAKLPRFEPARILTLPMRNALDVVAARRLSRFIREREIEIVHAHMARDYTLAALSVGRQRNARLILTRHVLFPLSLIHRATFARAARVIAVSNAVSKRLLNQNLCSAEKIVCIKNGIDFSPFNEAAGRKLLVDSHSTKYVGMLGELSSVKGQEYFIRAAALLANRFPDVQFTIAGEDSSRHKNYRRRLEALIDTLGLNARVRLLGRIENICEYLNSLDIFISASRSESFGLAIVEALACGVAVVSTETEGAKEILGDGASGVLVPVDDVQAMAEAMKELLLNDDQRRSLGRAGRVQAQRNFSIQRMIEETEHLYREVLDER